MMTVMLMGQQGATQTHSVLLVALNIRFYSDECMRPKLFPKCFFYLKSQ